MKINLSKEVLQAEVKINLSKAGFNSDNLCAKVAFVLDESGSMQHFYRNGTVQAILDKLLAVSYFFDDDGSIDMFAFANKARQLPEATQSDHGNYYFDPKYAGTEYAPAIQAVTDFYYKEDVKKSGGFLGFGGKKVVTPAEGRNDKGDDHPVYVFFLTDGETWDNVGAEVKFNDILSEHKDMFVQFVAVGDSKFSTLQKIVGNNPTNAALVTIRDIDAEGDQLLSQIITDNVRNVIEK